MLEFHRGRTRTDPGLSAKDAWLPPTTGLRDWRTDLAPADVELYEAIAGDLLSSLGYERASRTISPSVAARAERCRERWQADLAERPGRTASRLDVSTPIGEL